MKTHSHYHWSRMIDREIRWVSKGARKVYCLTLNHKKSTMIKVENPIVLEHALSERTIRILHKLIKEGIFGIMQWRSSRPIRENPLHPEVQWKIVRKLKRLGFDLYMGEDWSWQRNALLAYRRVNLHNDVHMKLNHSTVFIPLDIPLWVARFMWAWPDKKYHDLPIQEGSIVVFDQNKDHRIEFGEEDEGDIKFWIALFLDKSPTHPDSTPASHGIG